MKIEVNENIKKRKYPWIGKSIDDSSIIVFFNEHKKGTVLNSTVSHFCGGEYSENWNMDFFESFTGTITLSND